MHYKIRVTRSHGHLRRVAFFMPFGRAAPSFDRFHGFVDRHQCAVDCPFCVGHLTDLARNVTGSKGH